MSTAIKKRIEKIERAIAQVAPVGTDAEDTDKFFEALQTPSGMWHGKPAYTVWLEWVQSGELQRAIDQHEAEKDAKKE